jgi:hypothetical protein
MDKMSTFFRKLTVVYLPKGQCVCLWGVEIHGLSGSQAENTFLAWTYKDNLRRKVAYLFISDLYIWSDSLLDLELNGISRAFGSVFDDVCSAAESESDSGFSNCSFSLLVLDSNVWLMVRGERVNTWKPPVYIYRVFCIYFLDDPN